MGYLSRNCDNCGKKYEADTRNLKRGWGLCCSKSCAAKKREKSKPGYNPERVKANNIKRQNWLPEYEEGGPGENYDPGDSEYWNHKDF